MCGGVYFYFFEREEVEGVLVAFSFSVVVCEFRCSL